MLRRAIVVASVFAITLLLLFIQNKVWVGDQELQAEARPLAPATDGKSAGAWEVSFKDLSGTFINATSNEVEVVNRRLHGDNRRKEIAATVEGPTTAHKLLVTLTKPEDETAVRQRIIGAPYRRPNPPRPLFHVTRGIDLQGGVEFICQLYNEDNKRVDADAEVIHVLRERLDARGLTEPTVARLSNGDIQVVIPGGSKADASRTRKVLETTGRLEFREVLKVYGDLNAPRPDGKRYPEAYEAAAPRNDDGTPKYAGATPGAPDCAVVLRNNRYTFAPGVFHNRGDIIAVENNRSDPTALPKAWYHLGTPDVTGKDVAEAAKVVYQGQNAVSISFTAAGSGRNESFTRKVKDRGDSKVGTGSIAIVFDGKIYSDPHVEEASSTNCVIHGAFSDEEIDQLKNALRGGSLSVTPVVISERVVGATLGVETVHRAISTMVWATISIVVFLLLYYRRLGFTAALCMVALTGLTYATLSMFGATLTLPGIAGLVLSVAMSIDTNILIYERMREEMRAGKPLRDAIDASYDRVFAVVIDSHLTSMLTGLILYYVGSGPVKGFGLTLMLGIAISLFSNVYLGRLLTDLFCGRRQKVSMAQLIPEVRLPYIGMRKITYALSIITGLAGILWFAFGHYVVGGTFERNFDIEFTGGNLVQVTFDQPLTANEVRKTLADAHHAHPELQLLAPEELSPPQAYFGADAVATEGSREWVFRGRDEPGSAKERERADQAHELARLQRSFDQAHEAGETAKQKELQAQIDAVGKRLRELQDDISNRTEEFKAQLHQAFAGAISPEGSEIKAASWQDRTVHLTLATLEAPAPAALTNAAATMKKFETLEAPTLAAAPGLTGIEFSATLKQQPAADPTWQPEDAVARRFVELFGADPQAKEHARVAVDLYDGVVNALASQRVAVAKPFPSSQHFSGQVAGQMQVRAVLAIFIATLGMLAYIAARFEFGFGVAAVVATVHDLLLTLGLVSLFHLRVDLTVVAALLTIVGYSVNDTIVVFDRIRENLKKMADKPLGEVIDLSVAQTMPRTVLMGGSIILAMAAMILFAGESIRAFSATLLIGTILGTYSSVFVASPILLFFKRDKLIAPPPAPLPEEGPVGAPDEDEDEAPVAAAPKPA